MNTFSLALQTVLTSVAPFGGVALIAAMLWIVWRTQSGHALRYRAWRLLHGRTEITDPDIKRFVEERNELMTFRFLSGVQVRTAQNCRTLARWMREHNEEVRTIRFAGPYFDVEQLRVKTEALPSLARLLVTFVGSVLLFAAATYVTSLASRDHTFLKVNSTGTWFAVQSKGFAPATLAGKAGAPVVKLEDCKSEPNANLNAPALDARNVGVLCALLRDPAAEQYLSKNLAEQRAVFGVFAVVLGWWALPLLLVPLRVEVARQLSKRIAAREQQLPLPF